MSASWSRPSIVPVIRARPRGNPARGLIAIAAVFGLAMVSPTTSYGMEFGGASSDGSKVIFSSDEQLASGDTDGYSDVYERSGGTTTWISQGQINGNGAFGANAVGNSSDGSRVFFATGEHLVSGDTDNAIDIYERSGGTTTLVSQGELSGGVNHASFEGASDDGSKVFFSTAGRLVSGDTDSSLDLYERSGGTTTWISQGQINGNGAFNPTFDGASGDGSTVFFHTLEPLVSGDTDSSLDTYERSGGTTTWVSQGEVNGNGAFHPTFRGASDDGSKVFFETDEQLVSGDTDSVTDVYERSGGTTSWVSQGDIGGNGDFLSGFGGASDDGSKVFFRTNESLVSGDTDSGPDVYERSAGTTTWVSQGDTNGTVLYGASFGGNSSDGSKVFFYTDDQLVSGDTDGSFDVYERSGGTTTLISQGEEIEGDGHAYFLGASSDGATVVFYTDEQLVSGDTDPQLDIYQRSGGTTSWVSQGEINSNGPRDHDVDNYDAISEDGSAVFFTTYERLVSGDVDSTFSGDDVYQHSGGVTTLVSIDTAPPNTTINTGPSGTTNDPTPTFTFSSTDPGATKQCQVDAGAYAPCSSPITLAQLDDGSHTFSVRARDTFGNLDPTPATRTFTVDTVPPDTTITGGPSGATNDPTPSYTFSSSQTSSIFQCKVDAAAYAACASPKTTTHLDDGSHTFYVRARDPAGNFDPTPASRSFTVQTASVSVSGSTLVVTAATGAKDNLVITKPSASTLRVTDFPSGAYTGSGVREGAGCTRSGDYTANCSASGITLIQVVSGDQTDKVTNSTALKSSLNGGAANDLLTGGSAVDILIGGPNVDVLKGMNGNDDLRARDLTSDTTIDCGGGTADKADLDLLPKDPDSAVIGCETKTRH